jgi:hypothetical protein
MPIDSTMSRKNVENKSTRQYYGKFYSMENFIPKHFGQVKTIKQQNHVIIDWLIFDI